MILTQKSGFLLGNLAKLLGWIMNGIYNLFSSMGVVSIGLSIIVFTILIRLLMFPLSIRTTRSSKIQAHLKPEFLKITKKYKGKKDQASILAKQKETSALQKKYGIKMSAGCLTAIIQLPIFLSLYSVVQNIPAYVDKIKAMYMPIAEAIFGTEGAYEKMVTFIKENGLASRVAVAQFTTSTNIDSNAGQTAINSIIDVLAKCGNDAMDKLSAAFSSNSLVVQKISDCRDSIEQSNHFLFGINLSEAPGWAFTAALLIPIAAFAFQFLSMKVAPMQSTGDAQQDQQMKSMRKFMLIMPVMSFFVTISVPAGLGLYWAVSAAVSVVITLATNYYYNHADMDAITEKARLKAERKAERKKARNGGQEKKGFIERMQEAATGQNESEKKAQESAGMRNYGGARLKSYTSATSYKNEADEKKDVKYKPGSIASKANALRDYYQKNDKN